jgi:hypothetical protein
MPKYNKIYYTVCKVEQYRFGALGQAETSLKIEDLS